MKRRSMSWFLYVFIFALFFAGQTSANHQSLNDRSYAASEAVFSSSDVKGTLATLTIPSGFGYGSHACSSAAGESVFVQGTIWSNYNYPSTDSYVELAARRGRQVSGSPICRDDWYIRVKDGVYDQGYSCAGLKASNPSVNCPAWSVSNFYIMKAFRVTSQYYRLVVDGTVVADIYTPNADNPGRRSVVGWETNCNCGTFSSTAKTSGHNYTSTNDGSTWSLVPNGALLDMDNGYDVAGAHWDATWQSYPGATNASDK